MGEIYLDLTIANIQEPEQRRELRFFVDTGSTLAWIPQNVADELSIRRQGTATLEMADGRLEELPLGYCLFGYDSDTIAANVVIGPAQSEPLLGNVVLQELRFVIDLERHTISRRRALKAKSGQARVTTPNCAIEAMMYPR